MVSLNAFPIPQLCVKVMDYLLQFMETGHRQPVLSERGVLACLTDSITILPPFKSWV